MITGMIEKEPFSFNGVTYPVTVSLGAAVASAGEKVLSPELLDRADKNLYRAKAAGRNRLVTG